MHNRMPQAVGAIKAGPFARTGVYPESPYWYPNRATRRAVKSNRNHRLSSPWLQYLTINPQLRKVIKEM